MNEEIEALLNNRAEAVKAKAIEKVAMFYQEELRVFDLVEPLERQGRAEMIDRLKQWLSSFKEIQEYSFNDLIIYSSDTLAVCSLFNHVIAVKPDQTILDMWWRESLGLKKINGEWSIIHTHSSVPFNPENGMASMGLKPYLNYKSKK